MTITYTNNAKDLVAFLGLTALHSHWAWIGLIAFTAVTLPASIQAVPSDTELVIAILTVITMQLLFVAVVGLVAILLQLVGVGRKGYLPHTVTVSDEGLTERTRFDSTSSDWRGIHKVVSTRRYLVVYLSPIMGHVIPRTAFAGDDEWRRFVESVHDHWMSARA